jgi:DDE superfamily endonuclease
MFWGCFYSNIKGLGIFWEKDWSTINKESYRSKIISVIDGWIRLRQKEGKELVFMQDSAPAHAVRGTIQDLQERGIVCIQWPSYSPDLNPIETVWNWMKDWIQDRYDDELRGYDELRAAIVAAWEAVPAVYLSELLEQMPTCCQAVIDANGEHTRF